MALVAAGVGIAIAPEGVARANSDVAVREIDVDVKREVGQCGTAAVGSVAEFYHETAAARGQSRPRQIEGSA